MSQVAFVLRHSPVALAIGLLAAWSAHAQQAAPAQATSGAAQAGADAESAQRIEVTALKTRQALQEVPASVTALTAEDLARSGLVNAADLSLVLAFWGTPEQDIDGDGFTNAADLSLVLAYWGGCS
jgi:outer membrane receptor protein involved in Fe transport